MTDPPGVGTAAEIRRLNPAIAVIVITANESDDELFAAIRAGAFAYLGRDVSEESLFELIHRSARGEYVINEQLLARPYVAARVLDQFRGNVDHGPALERELIPLTVRELEILRRVGDGMTNAEIADLLGISSQTVKNHVTAILRKMAVNDRTHAVVTAFRRGWLTIEDEPDTETISRGVTDVPTSQLGSPKES
jgi:DNA-binding NarL/FixJ family response regulator